jgi:hypothetical protein
MGWVSLCHRIRVVVRGQHYFGRLVVRASCRWEKRADGMREGTR